MSLPLERHLASEMMQNWQIECVHSATTTQTHISVCNLTTQILLSSHNAAMQCVISTFETTPAVHWASSYCSCRFLNFYISFKKSFYYCKYSYLLLWKSFTFSTPTLRRRHISKEARLAANMLKQNRKLGIKLQKCWLIRITIVAS